jgi:hypothetical protein
MPKLGKLAPQFHPKTLAFEKYLTVELPVPASKVFREYAIPAELKQMYGNDQYGDCVWAMWANFIILTSSHTGNLVIPTLDDVLGAYESTGFDRATGMNDNGTSMTDSMEYMRTTGMAGVKILGWAKIDHTNRDHRNLGVQLFGATLVGVQFPESAQVQFAKGQSWEYVPDSPIEGGHAIIRPGYGRLGDDYGTWANWNQKASLEWSSRHVDEEYVAITPAWLDKATKKTPGGLDLATLQSDIAALSA